MPRGMVLSPHSSYPMNDRFRRADVPPSVAGIVVEVHVGGPAMSTVVQVATEDREGAG